MKAIKYTEIDGYNIVIGKQNLQIDAVKTKTKLKEIGQPITPANIKKFAIYFTMSNCAIVEDDKGIELESKLESLEANQRLDITGLIVPDFRHSTEYKKVNGKWTEKTIDKLGEIPEKTELNETEKQEYYKDIERETLSKLTPEEIEERKESELDALAREAVIKKQVADLRGKTFDEVKYFNEKKVDINKKYEVKK